MLVPLLTYAHVTGVVSESLNPSADPSEKCMMLPTGLLEKCSYTQQRILTSILRVQVKDPNTSYMFLEKEEGWEPAAQVWRVPQVGDQSSPGLAGTQRCRM